MTERSASEDMRQAKSMVDGVMAKYPRTRNSDTLLILQVWADQGAELHITKGTFMCWAEGDGLDGLMAPESITRARRVIQNDEGRLLPTDPQVLIRRRVREEQIREHFSGSPKLVGEWEALRWGVK